MKLRLIYKLDWFKGVFPGHVMEWYELHKDELLDNWKLIQETGGYNKIDPLE